METTQADIVHSSQVVSETGALSFGVLPLDLGMSQLANADKNTIILADGRLVKLTGTDEDIQLIAADRNMRVKQTLIHLYLSGLNLAITRDYFVEAYGSPKAFWDKMTELTGFSRGKLENEIRISQGFTAEEIESLAEAGVSQSIAVRLLKAAPAAKAEAVQEARQGRRITNAVVDELTGKDEEEEDAQDDNIDVEPIGSKEHLNGLQSATTDTELDTDQIIDVQGSFVDYKNLVTDGKDYVPSTKTAEERLQGLLASLYRLKDKHEIDTVRGGSLRVGITNEALAEFYGITLPEIEEKKDEPQWVEEARGKLPITSKRKFNANYLMAYVDGHLAYINGETVAPTSYEKLCLTVYKEKEKEKIEAMLEAMYDIWAIGYGLAKAVSEKAARK